MAQVLIKQVKTDEKIKIVEKLAYIIWNEHYPSIIGQGQVDYMLSKFQTKEAIKRSIENDGYHYYVAYIDDEPCGYTGFKIDDGLFLSKLYLEKSARGKGISKEMLNVVYQYAKDKGLNRIWLTCSRDNKNSLSVYEKLGFNIAREINMDIGNGFFMTDYVLEKNI